ncbi:MAG: amidohydrolase family protein [Paludibacteraceae bacterium]|nr:amidohydrolase family protein [Paludibacteraceae bacterium]
MIYDAHIHIGQFRDLYSTPQCVWNFLRGEGVEKFAVSTSTTCSEDYEKCMAEMQEIVHIGGEQIAPVFWISPSMLHNGWFEKFINCGIHWRCLKIHGYMHSWSENEIEQVITQAQQMNIPILFHTGGRAESDAGSYLTICQRHPEQIFVLAHARPIEQALAVMKAYPNVYADTAFTPIDAVKQLIDEGFASRVLFGTDYPLQRVFYPNDDISAMYQKQIADIQALMTTEQWDLVSHINFEKLYQ